MGEDRSHRAWYWLLLVPLVGLLIPPIYNDVDPELIGMPVLLLVPAGVGADQRRDDGARLPQDARAASDNRDVNERRARDRHRAVPARQRPRLRGLALARPSRSTHLDEWGLGGRKFGGWITWFLLGGDIYTAYTFVAVPALVFGLGAIGFFAVPYTIIVYPMVLLAAIRMWSVAHRHGFVTPADFVRGRFGSSSLALAVAITGIVATMPYIALQLVGIEAVVKTIGIEGDLPIIIAFAVLAAYTYSSGLRAPALIAFVKDTLIYIVVIVAIIVIPIELGGFDDIFSAADREVLGIRGAKRRHRAERRGDGRLFDARVRVRARAVSLSAHDDRHARRARAGTRSSGT